MYWNVDLGAPQETQSLSTSGCLGYLRAILINERGKIRLPLSNRLAHFRHVCRAVIDFSNCAHDAVGLVGDAAHLVIKQPLDNVRGDLQFSKLRAEGAAQIVE